jgi:kynurenine formamidase
VDDSYDDFYPQVSSQWDALSHIGHPVLGYYGGRAAATIHQPSTNELGIEQWARRGIAGRFVLVDIARSRSRRNEPLDMTHPTPIGVDEIESTLREQQVSLRGGDILLFRFGWIRWYEALDSSAKSHLAAGQPGPTPGLSQDESMAQWLWDNGVVAVAGDNPGIERYPADPTDIERFLHHRLITFLGFAVGELFMLEELAADSDLDGRYEGLFTAAPLNKAGGVGSPANALAIK